MLCLGAFGDGSAPQDKVETSWRTIGTSATLLPAGHQIGKSELLFRKIEDDEIENQLAKLEATKQGQQAGADGPEKTLVEVQKERVSHDDFAKLDMRAGTILEAEKMPKADRLLVLKVDTGLDIRTIVSGIADSFSPEEIIGKRVIVLINLAPRKLRGVESQGMILMTQNADGKSVFVSPDGDGFDNGHVVH